MAADTATDIGASNIDARRDDEAVEIERLDLDYDLLDDAFDNLDLYDLD